MSWNNKYSNWSCGCDIDNWQVWAGEMFGGTSTPGWISYTHPVFWMNPAMPIWDLQADFSTPQPAAGSCPENKRFYKFWTKVPCCYWPFVTSHQYPDGEIKRRYEWPRPYNENWVISDTQPFTAYITAKPIANSVFSAAFWGFRNVHAPQGIYGGTTASGFGSTSWGPVRRSAITSWSGKRQKYVDMFAEPYSFSPFDEHFHWILSGPSQNIGTYDAEWIRADVDTGQEIFRTQIGVPWEWYYDVESEGWQLLTCLRFFWGRRSLSFGTKYFCFSSYDDDTSYSASWIVSRQLAPGQSGSSHYCVAVPNLGQWTICCPSSRVYDDDGEPWVIAKDGDKWATGIWTNTTMESASPGARGKAVLLPSEVENIITSGGEMQSTARCLCYNRSPGRDLAIFYDAGSRIATEDDDCFIEAGYTISAYRVNYIDAWIYDSKRTVNKLFKYASSRYCYRPNGKSDPNQDQCFIPQEALEQFPIDVGAHYDPTVWTRIPFTKACVPSYIIEDLDGDVYIGSPKFIRKYKDIAKDWNEEYEWELKPEDYFPYTTIQLNPGCDAERSFTRVPIPYSNRFGSATGGIGVTTYFGHLDYRDFTIQPMSYGIQVRNFQATAEMSSEDLTLCSNLNYVDGKSYELFPYDQYPFYDGNDSAQKWAWVNSWTISHDGKRRVPHLEAANLVPDVCFKPDPPKRRFSNEVEFWMPDADNAYDFLGYWANKAQYNSLTAFGKDNVDFAELDNGYPDGYYLYTNYENKDWHLFNRAGNTNLVYRNAFVGPNLTYLYYHNGDSSSLVNDDNSLVSAGKSITNPLNFPYINTITRTSRRTELLFSAPGYVTNYAYYNTHAGYISQGLQYSGRRLGKGNPLSATFWFDGVNRQDVEET